VAVIVTECVLGDELLGVRAALDVLPRQLHGLALPCKWMMLCSSVSGIHIKTFEAGNDAMGKDRQINRMNGSNPRSTVRYRIFVLLFMVVFALASVESNAASRIELVDGTQINGEVMSFSNGRYIIRSTTLGQIELPESAIRSINPGGDKGSGGTVSAESQSFQQQIVNSPELMQMVTTLMADPEIQAAIKDPELMRLIMSGDMNSLQNDPRILRLMTNPSMQAIIGKMNNR
jgi:hypothetical protein